MAKKKADLEPEVTRGPVCFDGLGEPMPPAVVPISQVHAIPRAVIDADADAQLAASIRDHGLFHPITLRLRGDNEYEVVAGARRFRAMTLLGLEEIPAHWSVIRALTDQDTLMIRHLENLNRMALHPIEALRDYEALIESGMTIADVSQRTGQPVRTIERTLRLATLTPTSRQAFIERRIVPEVASQLARIVDPVGQAATLKYALTGTYLFAGQERRDFIAHQIPTPWDVARHIRERVLLSLGVAPFDTGIEIAGVGPCTVCPKRSGNQAALFDFKQEELTENLCLDAPCYARKAAAAAEARAEALKAEGTKVITPAQLKKAERQAVDEKKIGYTGTPLDAHRGGSGGNTYIEDLGEFHTTKCLAACPDHRFVNQGDKVQEICLNQKCLATLLRLSAKRAAAPASAAAHDDVSEEERRKQAKARRDQRKETLQGYAAGALDKWLVPTVGAALRSKAKVPTDKPMLAILKLALLISLENWHAGAAATITADDLKAALGWAPKHGWGASLPGELWERLDSMSPAKLVAGLAVVLPALMPSRDSAILRAVGAVVGVDAMKQYRLSSDDLHPYQKPELTALAKSFKIELPEEADKGAMIDAIAKALKPGMLPVEWEKVID
jgi:ParB/RepB/Spo0J family partition protein